jgi:DNA-3-methyladenine glycosylase
MMPALFVCSLPDRPFGGGDASRPEEKRVPKARSIAVRRFRQSALPVSTVELARWLLGKTLVHELPEGETRGRIVETEAYVVGDSSGHAFRGITPRNQSLFLSPGHAYVYFVYGCWWALNISAEVAGVGAGVLLRALEPLQGIALMQQRRGVEHLEDLARGPGRLATAMGVDRQQDGVALFGGGRLRLEPASQPLGEIATSVRIGLSREAHRLLRFYERGNRFVSGPRRLRE